jgi:TRAP-type mannitol/chloroaromatic compound transport system substrate-binding protein
MKTDKESTAPSRRKFLTGAAAAATGAAAAGFPMIAKAQAPIVIKMQGSWSATDIFNEMAMEFVDRVNSMSGGRLKVDYLVGGAVVKSFEVMDAVSKGVLDAGHTVPVYWYGKSKVASLFGSGPINGCDAFQTLAWIYRGGGLDLYKELLTKLNLNVVGFFAMPMPTQPLGWFKKPITDAKQLKGLKYRTVGLAADLFQQMGAKVTQLSGGEIIPALERGVIEAFEFNNPTSDSRFGAQDVSKVYMMGSYHQAAEFFEIIFNKDRFDSLDPDMQAILEYAAEAANTANYGLAMNQYSADLQKLINEDGVNVYRTPTSVMEAQLASWDTVLEDLTQDAFFGSVVESQRQWSERVAFYDIMNSADYKLAFKHYFPGKIDF